jgi:hypothetical protein
MLLKAKHVSECALADWPNFSDAYVKSHTCVGLADSAYQHKEKQMRKNAKKIDSNYMTLGPLCEIYYLGFNNRPIISNLTNSKSTIQGS